LREVVNLYIERRDDRNSKLEDRVSDLFATYIGVSKEMGVVRVFAMAALGLAVTILGSIMVGLVK